FITVLLAFVILLLYLYIRYPAGWLTPETSSQLPELSDTVLKEKVQILTRQAARWSTAASQDNNPLIAVLHANYGAGYLWAIHDNPRRLHICDFLGSMSASLCNNSSTNQRSSFPVLLHPTKT